MAGDPLMDEVNRIRGVMFQSAPAIDGGRSAQRPQQVICAGRCFNPRPPSMAGDPPICRTSRKSCRWFQSAPAIDGGRSAHGARNCQSHQCFNPRPPSMAGDPPAGASNADVVAVSIRARHRWRAIRFKPNEFDIPTMFQSAPAIDGGRSTDTADNRQGLCDVSIRARHRWRAILAMASDDGISLPVSIRARHRWRAIQGSSCSSRLHT